MNLPAGHLEWLETSELGSFALGCVDRKLRRKYHCLLTVREPGRGDAWNVLAELIERVRVQDGDSALLANPLVGGAEQTVARDLAPAETAALIGFSAYPDARHQYRALGLTITRTVRFGAGDQVEIHYRVRGAQGPLQLALAPLVRAREIHGLTFENPFLDGSLTAHGQTLHMQPYAGMPAIAFRVDGADVSVRREGRWLGDVHYPWEQARGYEAHEHLFTPGWLELTLEGDADVTLVVGLAPLASSASDVSAPGGESASRPPSFAEKLERAAAQFLMRTRAGEHTIVAGYPWFGPWGRDTLIALPGLYLATGDFERTADVLDTMLRARINGLVPNIPALGDNAASTSSIDASLLFTRAVQWLGQHAGADKIERFMPAVCELLEAIADARDGRMRLDDGVGVWTERGPWALTWMDAMVDGAPVTPRAGYAIEVDALAYNAAQFAVTWADGRRGAFARAFRTRLRGAEADFLRRYWDDARGYLADSHDGTQPDGSLRPNQLFALGLPHRAVPESIARASLEAVTRALVTPAGLRTLAPSDRSYFPHYAGAQLARDLAYHQGTIWPWLVGIYADAVHATSGRDALEPRLAPILSYFVQHLDHEGCIGQVGEVFSGAAPHLPGGTPAQAWSVAELYRALRLLRDGP